MTETKYKVWVLAFGEHSWATNGLEFDTVPEAFDYGRELLARWFAADKYKVLPSLPELTGHLNTKTIELYEEVRP